MKPIIDAHQLSPDARLPTVQLHSSFYWNHFVISCYCTVLGCLILFHHHQAIQSCIDTSFNNLLEPGTCIGWDEGRKGMPISCVAKDRNTLIEQSLTHWPALPAPGSGAAERKQQKHFCRPIHAPVRSPLVPIVTWLKYSNTTVMLNFINA